VVRVVTEIKKLKEGKIEYKISCIECEKEFEIDELMWDEYGKLRCPNCGLDEFVVWAINKEGGEGGE
jgi:DNA-directed RNA polymerase subunit RPC12/RpoP